MSGYDLDAMRQALLKCDENIKVFEAAIKREEETKAEYRRIIRVLEEKEAEQVELNKNVKPS